VNAGDPDGTMPGNENANALVLPNAQMTNTDASANKKALIFFIVLPPQG
jgi:hypothetical protein